MICESTDQRRKLFLSFSTGVIVGALGGLIGLGGAEFRLPLLLTVFGYATLPAVIVNLVVSLATVFFSFSSDWIVDLAPIASSLPMSINILACSLIGSCCGTRLATHIGERAPNGWLWDYS